MLRGQFRTELDRIGFKTRGGQICVTMIPARWQTRRRHQVHRAQVTRREEERRTASQGRLTWHVHVTLLQARRVGDVDIWHRQGDTCRPGDAWGQGKNAPACLPARGSMELRGAARIRAAATDVAGSAVTLANEVHYNVLSN